MLAALDGLGKIFDSIRANVYKEAMTAPTITVFVCLGSNTPDAAHMLSLAVERLRALPRARVDALSDIYLTEPQDYADQPWFHNQVVRMELETDWTPQSFVRALLAEEKQLGRQRSSDPALRFGPRCIDMDLLREHCGGLIACSACLAGELPRLLLAGEYDQAKATALEMQELFGPDGYYLELQDHGIPSQKQVNAGLRRLHEETGIPLIATNDAHYLRREDAEMQDTLMCIQMGKTLDDPGRMKFQTSEFYVKSEDEMRALFPYAQEALDNTHKIAERCNVEIEFGVTKLPQYDVPDGYTSWEYLQKLCRDGFQKRYPNDDGALRERLSYELDVIHSMGYVDYFLIVWDFIHFAKSHDIMVGPGRGSAAGSIVAYSLGITDIDPIRYQLLFERFLNPERVSMPDIDIDFCFERRQEVIDYVVSKYGKDRVVQIVTFGTLAAKGVVRDVGRVLDMPYAKCDSIAKMIPGDLGMTLDKALKASPDLRNAYQEDDEVKYLIDMSRRLEGLPRHTSMHAAGVVISKASVDEYVPL